MNIKISLIILSFFSMTVVKAQEKVKDTLFFKLDNYLYQFKFDSKQYIVKDNYDIKDGAIYFETFKIINTAKPKEILCFRKYAKTANLYMINNPKKLNDVKVTKLFDNYIIILVNKKNKQTTYTEVGPVFAIE
ncbi:hypothetical protein [Flavobacterium sp. N502540]|uniref:hypothetical protein n=1 Tax=Flavobacterium sp. N502540 TaxID=2986838 RepID=UPI002224C762|nr:hypothetical protein [Flavobacterium sp. N502540]